MRLLESKLYDEDINRVLKALDLNSLCGKTIFITGGLGLIGSTIVDVLLNFSDIEHVYVGARSRQQYEDRYGGYRSVSFIEYDALKNNNLDISPDYIICGAGLSSPELYTRMPVETMLSNFDGIRNLLDFAKENSNCRVLYISSSEVYGRMNSSSPHVEDKYGTIDIANIRSSYAVAKKASEMLCNAYNLEYGVDVVIVRPGHIFGPSAKKSDKRVASDFAFRAAEGEKIVLKSSGLQKRSYCYSVDCAAQILLVLMEGKRGQSYNVGQSKTTSIREIAELYAKFGNVDLESCEASSNERRQFNPMNDSSLDIHKLNALGYNTLFSVEEGLEHTVRILKGE